MCNAATCPDGVDAMHHVLFLSFFYTAVARWVCPLGLSIVREQGHMQRGDVPQWQ
jgi:hypothetical protein